MSYKRQERLTLRKHLGLSPVFSGVYVANLFSFLCCVFSFVFLHSMSCVLDVASVSGLSILDLPFGFL